MLTEHLGKSLPTMNHFQCKNIPVFQLLLLLLALLNAVAFVRSLSANPQAKIEIGGNILDGDNNTADETSDEDEHVTDNSSFYNQLKWQQRSSSANFIEKVAKPVVQRASKVNVNQRSVDADQFIELLNKKRASLGASNMRCLTWSSDLVAFASKWTDLCTIDRNPATSRVISGSSRAASKASRANCYDSIGYVYFIGRDLTEEPSAKFVVEELTDKAKFNYETNTCSTTEVGDCDNLRQILWATSAEVGCSIKKCDKISGATKGGYVGACAFGLKASTKTTPFNRGAACSCCPEWKSQCSNKLCCGPKTPCSGGDEKNNANECHAIQKKQGTIQQGHALPVFAITPHHPKIPEEVRGEGGGAGCSPEDEQFCAYWKENEFCENVEMLDQSRSACSVTCHLKCKPVKDSVSKALEGQPESVKRSVLYNLQQRMRTPGFVMQAFVNEVKRQYPKKKRSGAATTSSSSSSSSSATAIATSSKTKNKGSSKRYRDKGKKKQQQTTA